MNNKGFTLIELIATIALLGIIVLISFVSINKVIENSKKTECLSLVESIKAATKEYVSDNRYKNVLNCDGTSGQEIGADTLTSGSSPYLSTPIVNPYDKNDEIEPSDIRITVVLNKNCTVSSVSVTNDKLACIQ